MRSSTWRLEDLRNVILNLGFVGENLHTRQIFDCKKMFDQYPNASVSMTVTPPEGEPYPGTIERDGDLVIWDVRDSDLVAEGDGEIQLVFTQAPHIARSYNARTHICRSQVQTGSIPSGLDDYITRADQLLDEVKDTFPDGGTTGQVLAKKSDTDYDTEWVDQGGGTEDYDELENRPQIGGVTLTGNKTLHDLGAASEGDVDAKYTKPAGGIPASDIADGVIKDPEDLIDDTAGEGDTDKVWSADKSHALLTEINSKDATNIKMDATDQASQSIGNKIGQIDSAIASANTAIGGKVSEPAQEGTAGSVLTTDGDGQRSWSPLGSTEANMSVSGTTLVISSSGGGGGGDVGTFNRIYNVTLSEDTSTIDITRKENNTGNTFSTTKILALFEIPASAVKALKVYVPYGSTTDGIFYENMGNANYKFYMCVFMEIKCGRLFGSITGSTNQTNRSSNYNQSNNLNGNLEASALTRAKFWRDGDGFPAGTKIQVFIAE